MTRVRVKTLLLAGLVAASVLLIAAVVALTLRDTQNRSMRTDDRATAAVDRSVKNRDTVKSVEASVEQTEDRLSSNVKQTKTITRVLVRSGLARRGRDGLVGPGGLPGPAPTDAQVDAAVSRFCAENGCSRGPTDAQVLAALVAFCADGECRGRAGDDGEDAPPPTDEQLDAAVERYCMVGMRCRGTDGADSIVAGPQGPQGLQGEKGDPGTPAAQPATATCVPTADPADDPATFTCTFG